MFTPTGEPQKTPAVEGAEAWNLSLEPKPGILSLAQAIQRVSEDQGTQPTGSCHCVMKDDTVYGKLTQYRKAVTVYSYRSKEVQ